MNVSKWLAFVPYPYTKEDAIKYIEDSINNKLYNFAIVLKSENKVIGSTQLSNISKIHGTAGGGIWINEKYHGNGYAIQSWGAYGANGGDARSYDGNRTTQGGDGGAGAYVCGYAYLNCGDSVTVLIGSSSDEPSLVQATTDNNRIALGIGGAGGGYSAVAVNSTYVTVAGGGGGGGGATENNIQGSIRY